MQIFFRLVCSRSAGHCYISFLKIRLFSCADFLSSDFITAYFKSADCGPLLNHISQKMNVFMRRFFIPRFYICSVDFKSADWAIATYYFSRAKCFHSQIFYPQISYLQILNPQIWAISTSRFSKIECFLMDLQTFEEEIFKHSKLFLSIFCGGKGTSSGACRDQRRDSLIVQEQRKNMLLQKVG